MSILDKAKKASTIADIEVLTKSAIYNEKDMIVLPVPMMNVSFSGKLSGGYYPGFTMICGPSKHFKTNLALLLAKSFQDKYEDKEDYLILFFDGEFGTPLPYFRSMGINTDKVLHIPFKNIEELRFELIKQLDNFDKKDKVFILIDSIGNAASKKEVEDALNEKGAEDMTRAKKLKSLFRSVTPYLSIKDIPMVAVNHIYMEQGMYPKAIVSGGTGPYLSADTIFIMGRSQIKEGDEVVGYQFTLNVEKSRYVKEKSKISLQISYEEGINPWSGLLENGLESGFVIKPKVGWYQKIDPETGEILDKNYRAADTNTKDFWLPILKSQKFQEFIQKKYALSISTMIDEDEIEKIYGSIDEDE